MGDGERAASQQGRAGGSACVCVRGALSVCSSWEQPGDTLW